MLLSELISFLTSVRDNVSSSDIPVLINGFPIELVGVDIAAYNRFVLKLWIKPSQVEDLKSET